MPITDYKQVSDIKQGQMKKSSVSFPGKKIDLHRTKKQWEKVLEEARKRNGRIIRDGDFN